MSGVTPVHPSDENRIVAEMTRELEAMTMTMASPVKPTEGFADRVMDAIAGEPLPQPVRAFGMALVGGHLRAAAVAVGDAWRTISSAPAPMAVRAQALALVLVVIVGSLAVAGGATVGAIGLLGGIPPTPGPSIPPPSLVIPGPSPSPAPATPSEGPAESPTAEPSDSSEPTDMHETEKPTVRPRTATPTATDDHGGGSGSGSGSGSGDHTPSPTETDDSSGGDG